MESGSIVLYVRAVVVIHDLMGFCGSDSGSTGNTNLWNRNFAYQYL